MRGTAIGLGLQLRKATDLQWGWGGGVELGARHREGVDEETITDCAVWQIFAFIPPPPSLPNSMVIASVTSSAGWTVRLGIPPNPATSRAHIVETLKRTQTKRTAIHHARDTALTRHNFPAPTFS
jgi:hypothetical protein